MITSQKLGMFINFIMFVWINGISVNNHYISHKVNQACLCCKYNLKGGFSAGDYNFPNTFHYAIKGPQQPTILTGAISEILY